MTLTAPFPYYGGKRRWASANPLTQKGKYREKIYFSYVPSGTYRGCGAPLPTPEDICAPYKVKDIEVTANQYGTPVITKVICTGGNRR